MRFQTMNSSPARSHWIRPRRTPPSVHADGVVALSVERHLDELRRSSRQNPGSLGPRAAVGCDSRANRRGHRPVHFSSRHHRGVVLNEQNQIKNFAGWFSRPMLRLATPPGVLSALMPRALKKARSEEWLHDRD